MSKNFEAMFMDIVMKLTVMGRTFPSYDRRLRKIHYNGLIGGTGCPLSPTSAVTE
jgi:hypothetical protein